jgi:hypothetical protein
LDIRTSILGGSAARRLGGSAARRLGGSAARRLGGSAAAKIATRCHCEAAPLPKQPCSPKAISWPISARATTHRALAKLRREIPVGLQGCFARRLRARNDSRLTA